MLKEQIDMNISKTIDLIFDTRNIQKYLNVAAKFPFYDYKNQVLIYKQRPDAKTVAGKTAFEAGGRSVSPNAHPIALLYPVIRLEESGKLFTENGKTQVDEKTGVPFFEIEPKYAAEFRPEIVYDIADTTRIASEDEDLKVSMPDLTDRIKYLTDYIIRDGDDREFDSISQQGIFNPDEREFVLRRQVDGKDNIQRTLIELYIAYDFYYDAVDATIVDYTDVIKRLVLYVVLTYFSLIRNDFSLIFVAKLSPASHEVKEEILAEIQKRAAEIIQDLSVYYISFNEIAIANSVIRSGKYENIEIMFSKAISGIQDNELINEMNNFKKKLYFSQEGFLEALYNDISNRKLFTWPVRLLPYDAKKYDN